MLITAFLVGGSGACFLDLSTQEKGFEISGYGEMLYQHLDYGPDQKSGINGSPTDSRAIMDIPRFVFSFEYHFTKNLYFETEIEFEHGGTGSALELEKLDRRGASDKIRKIESQRPCPGGVAENPIFQKYNAAFSRFLDTICRQKGLFGYTPSHAI